MTATSDATVRRLVLPKYHAAQRQMDSIPARFHVEACGRRFGKSLRCFRKAVEPALEGKPTAWYAPTYKQLLPIWLDAVERLGPVTERKSATDRTIQLLTGGAIEFWSLEDDGDASRGRKYARVIVDEAAHVTHLETAWQNVIRPTLTDYQGDAYFPSTPNGLNYYHTLYQRGRDPQYPDWVSWQFPSSANPYLAPEEIEASRRDLPERVFAQEMEAAFLEDGGGVFRRVKEACTATAQEKAIQGHQYVVGVDWAKVNDFTVLVVLDVTTGEVVALERFNQIDWPLQLSRLQGLCYRFDPSVIVAERNAMGDPLISQLQERSLPVWGWTATNATKGAAIEALSVALEQGKVRLLDDPVLVGELLAYDAERLPSGMIRYSAPEGQHDDCVMALAMAWQGAVGQGWRDIPTSVPFVDHDATVSVTKPPRSQPAWIPALRDGLQQQRSARRKRWAQKAVEEAVEEAVEA